MQLDLAEEWGANLGKDLIDCYSDVFVHPQKVQSVLWSVIISINILGHRKEVRLWTYHVAWERLYGILSSWRIMLIWGHRDSNLLIATKQQPLLTQLAGHETLGWSNLMQMRTRCKQVKEEVHFDFLVFSFEARASNRFMAYIWYGFAWSSGEQQVPLLCRELMAHTFAALSSVSAAGLSSSKSSTSPSVVTGSSTAATDNLLNLCPCRRTAIAKTQWHLSFAGTVGQFVASGGIKLLADLAC